MFDSLRECLEWTSAAATDGVKRMTDAPEALLSPLPSLAEAIGNLDIALTKTMKTTPGNRPHQNRLLLPAVIRPPGSRIPARSCERHARRMARLRLSRTIVINHYRRKLVKPAHFVKALQDLIDAPDEENTSGRPESDIEKPSPNLLAAEQRFIESPLLEYDGYCLEIAAATMINVRR